MVPPNKVEINAELLITFEDSSPCGEPARYGCLATVFSPLVGVSFQQALAEESGLVSLHQQRVAHASVPVPHESF